MEYRHFGRTGLTVSALGFGCGATGGLLVKGERREMVRTVSRAIEAGINYFDTARIYGDGTSEVNLGLVLEELKPDIIVGTKVQLQRHPGIGRRRVERVRRTPSQCVPSC